MDPSVPGTRSGVRQRQVVAHFFNSKCQLCERKYPERCFNFHLFRYDAEARDDDDKMMMSTGVPLGGRSAAKMKSNLGFVTVERRKGRNVLNLEIRFSKTEKMGKWREHNNLPLVLAQIAVQAVKGETCQFCMQHCSHCPHRSLDALH